MSTLVDQAIEALASRQCGTFTRLDALRLGATDSLINRRLRSGRWIRLAPGVYGLPGVASSFQQRLWIAVHSGGEDATVSHESAASARWLTASLPDDIEVTVPHGRHPVIPGVVVHQSRILTPVDVGRVKGLPVTTVPRTLVDLAPRFGTKHLGLLLDEAVNDKKASMVEVHQTFARLAVPGRRGMLRLATVLDERGPGYVPPASELERGLFEVIERAGLPAPIRQMEHPGRAVTRGCVDAGWRPTRLIIEADGRRWHTRIQDLARDHWRDAEALRVGYDTLRLLWENIMGDPEGTACLARDVYDLRCELMADARRGRLVRG